MMYRMTSKWARLGQKLKSARTARGIGVLEATTAIGIKRGALYNIEKGEITRVTPSVKTYAHLVGWTEDSVEAVLDGGEPTMRGEGQAERSATDHGSLLDRDGNPRDVAPSASHQMPTDLSVRIQQALGEGPLLDARVAEVTTPTGLVRATIVIRGESGVSAEDLLAALESVRVDVRTEDD